MPERLVLPELEEIQPFLSVPSCVTLPPCQGHQMTGLYPSEVVRSTSGQNTFYTMLTVDRGWDSVWTGHIVVNILQFFRGSELCFMCLVEMGFGWKWTYLSAVWVLLLTRAVQKPQRPHDRPLTLTRPKTISLSCSQMAEGNYIIIYRNSKKLKSFFMKLIRC